MPNPLRLIYPILDLLGREVKILPATGGAVEDLQHPDQQEIEASYAMFLIQSILQRTTEEEKKKLAIVILNVKHGDLLQIDQRREKEFSVEEMEMWEVLGLKPEPFNSNEIHYYLPRGREWFLNMEKNGKEKSMLKKR